MPEQNSKGLHSVEQVYALYKKHNGVTADILKDEACTIKSRQTLSKYIIKHQLRQRREHDLAEVNKIAQEQATLNADNLLKLKDGIIAKIMKIASEAATDDIKNIYALKSAWEILRTELNLPTTISQNANLNIDAYAHKRSLEEIDRDIADFLIAAEDASPNPPTGEEDGRV